MASSTENGLPPTAAKYSDDKMDSFVEAPCDGANMIRSRRDLDVF